MTEMGKAMMGTGEASGEDRALMAAQNAIQNPLLDEASLKGAKALLVNITGGPDMTLLEVDEVANTIADLADPEANIILGAAFDPKLVDTVRVSVVATGIPPSPATSPRNMPKEHQPPTEPEDSIPLAPAVRAPQSAEPLIPDVGEGFFGGLGNEVGGSDRHIGWARLFRRASPRQASSSRNQNVEGAEHAPGASIPENVKDPTSIDAVDLEIPTFLRRKEY